MPDSYRIERVLLVAALLFIVYNIFRTTPTHTTTPSANSDVERIIVSGVNRQRLEYEPHLASLFDELCSRQAQSADPDLVSLVKQLMDPPSGHGLRKPAHAIFQTPQAQAVDEHFKEQVSTVEMKQ